MLPGHAGGDAAGAGLDVPTHERSRPGIGRGGGRRFVRGGPLPGDGRGRSASRRGGSASGRGTTRSRQVRSFGCCQHRPLGAGYSCRSVADSPRGWHPQRGLSRFLCKGLTWLGYYSLPQLVVDALDHVGGVDDLADLRGNAKNGMTCSQAASHYRLMGGYCWPTSESVQASRASRAACSVGAPQIRRSCAATRLRSL